jgi:hypothetical protein
MSQNCTYLGCILDKASLFGSLELRLDPRVMAAPPKLDLLDVLPDDQIIQKRGEGLVVPVFAEIIAFLKPRYSDDEFRIKDQIAA